MKLIKMRINRTKQAGATHYEYPTPHYDAQKVAYGPIYEGGLPDVVQSDVLPRNADDEFIIIGVADSNVAQFLAADGYEKDGFTYTAKEVTKTKATTDGKKWTGPQTEKITDQAKVLQILVKVAKKEALTQEEEDAINPDKKDVPGIVKTKSFEEGLDEAIANN